MRPMVSAVGSPTYDRAKWLTEYFGNLLTVRNNFFVKNSFKFIGNLKNVYLQDSEIFFLFRCMFPIS